MEALTLIVFAVVVAGIFVLLRTLNDLWKLLITVAQAVLFLTESEARRQGIAVPIGGDSQEE